MRDTSKIITSTLNLPLVGIICLVLLFSCSGRQHTIGLIVGNAGNRVELDSVINFIRATSQYDYELVSVQQACSIPLTKYNIVWYHQPDSTSTTDSLALQELIQAINHYVGNGGKLLLTLDAVKLLYPMKLEAGTLRVKYKNA